MKETKKEEAEFVKVTITLPKPLHDFMDKFAELEGYHAEDWYVNWIHGEFEAFLESFNRIDVDVKNLIETNDLKETLEDRNPGIVHHILHGDW